MGILTTTKHENWVTCVNCVNCEHYKVRKRIEFPIGILYIEIKADRFFFK